MPVYTLAIETTSNATAGGTGGNSAIQLLMPASRQCRLIGVLVKQQATAAGEHSGLWVVDRISAVSTGSTLVPLKMDPYSRASDITDTTITVSSTLACAPTVVATTGVAILTLADGWNDFRKLNLYSGVNQGFAIRRATAPTGARVVDIMTMWEE